MLDKVGAAHARMLTRRRGGAENKSLRVSATPREIRHDCRLQPAGDLQLVEAGEDDRRHLLLGVQLGNQVAAQDLQPAFPRPHLLPQVGRAVPVGIHRVARAPVVTPVERQEAGRRAIQLGDHGHRAIADGEMDQGPPGEGQQRFGSLALRLGHPVEAVLVDGVGQALGEVGL